MHSSNTVNRLPNRLKDQPHGLYYGGLERGGGSLNSIPQYHPSFTARQADPFWGQLGGIHESATAFQPPFGYGSRISSGRD